MKKLRLLFITIVFTVITYTPAIAESIEGRIENIEKQLDASWKFYGNVMMSTFYEKYRAKDLKLHGATDSKGTTWGLNTNAAIGATATMGDIEGVFEYGHKGGAGDKNVNTRLLYGAWNFMPEGKLVIGYDDTPLYFGISNQVYYNDNNLSGFGILDGDKAAQIKLIYKGFQLALIDPTPGMSDIGLDETKVFFPRVEATYDFSFGPLAGKIMGGYKTYKAIGDKGMPTEFEERINSWVAGIGLLYDAAPFYIGINGFYGSNVGALGQAAIGAPDEIAAVAGFDESGMPYLAGSELVNAKTFGIAAALGYKYSEMLSFEVGYGYQEDKWKSSGIKDKLVGQSYYLNATITVAKGFYIVPEVGIMRYKCKGTTSLDAGKSTYFGAKWQIEF